MPCSAGSTLCAPGAAEMNLHIHRRADALEQRLDALRRRCSTGYGCGSACISLRKECRTTPGAAIGKQRLQRLLALAAGAPSGQRGIARVKATEAADLAGGITARRGQQAAQLRSAREQAAAAAGPKPFASPNDLSFDLARQAHSGTSFDPERRGKQHQADYADHLNSVHRSLSEMATTPEQKAIFEQEIASYRDGYKARYTAWLQAKSRIMSPMISGPARFPSRQMGKANATEQKRLQELIDFSKKGQERIRRKLSAARDPVMVAAESAADQAKMIRRSLANIAAIDQGAEGFQGLDRRLFASNLAGRIARMANRGELEAVQAALDQINVDQRSMKRPAFTPKHSIWDLVNVAHRARLKATAAEAAPADALKTPEFKSGGMERDYEAERVRIQFNDGKPSDKIRAMLKGAGWRWSPTNTAWQRMNTENSVYSARRILEAADREREGRGDSQDPPAALPARLDDMQVRSGTLNG